MSKLPCLRYHFGDYCLHVSERRLTWQNRPVPLPAKSFEVLQVLVENAGGLVEKEDLLKRLWPNTYVEESNLAKQISILRKVLEDGASGRDYIETVPKYGYRFIAAVSVSDSGRENGADALTRPVATVDLPARKARKWVFVTISAAAIVLVFAAGVRRWVGSRSKNAEPDFQLLSTLTDSGRVDELSISPDGRYVAYLQREASGIGIRLRQTDTPSDISVLNPQYATFAGLTFSPDGNYLYFARSGNDEGSEKSLYRIPVLGGTSHKVMDGVDSAVSFSPDGREIAFVQNSGSGEGVFLKTAFADGREPRVLARFPDASVPFVQIGPSWSPDGKTIAVTLFDSGTPQRTMIRLVSLADRSVRDLYSSTNSIGRVAWLAGGRDLVVPKNDASDHGQLWAISLADGKARQLTHDLTDYVYPLSITRDGGQLVALGATGVISDVWLARSDTFEKGIQLSSGLPLFLVLNAPNGNVLGVSDDGQLWALGPNHQRRALLSELPMKSQLARCGASMVITSYASGETAILKTIADGSDSLKLTSGRLRWPVCSPDGRFVFYVDLAKPYRIMRMPAAGGLAEEIAKVAGVGLAGRMSIAPNGKFLTYAYRQQSGTDASGWYLSVLPTTGAGPTRTYKVPRVTSGPKWSPSGDGLDVVLWRDGGMNIWRQSLSAEGLQPVTHFVDGEIFDFDWSPDGSQLLLARGTANHDVVLLANRSR
jgi:eukaryotic-like serine/threonine-protein kinase